VAADLRSNIKYATPILMFFDPRVDLRLECDCEQEPMTGNVNLIWIPVAFIDIRRSEYVGGVTAQGAREHFYGCKPNKRWSAISKAILTTRLPALGEREESR